MAKRRQERNVDAQEGPAANDPTPEAIKAACERIRKAWTPGEAKAREKGLTWNHRSYQPAPWLPQVFSRADLPR